jgi:hypothetical protein
MNLIWGISVQRFSSFTGVVSAASTIVYIWTDIIHYRLVGSVAERESLDLLGYSAAKPLVNMTWRISAQIVFEQCMGLIYRIWLSTGANKWRLGLPASMPNFCLDRKRGVQ